MGRGGIYLITGGWGGLNPNAPSFRKTPLSQILRRWKGKRCAVGEREKAEGEEGGGEKVDRFVRGSLARAALLLGAI